MLECCREFMMLERHALDVATTRSTMGLEADLRFIDVRAARQKHRFEHWKASKQE